MKRGIILLIFANIFWSGNIVCGRYLANALPATLLNTIRWIISTVIIFGILALMKKRVPILKMGKEFAILGFFGCFGFSTLNYTALRYISAAQSGMITAICPVVIMILSIFILKEHINKKAWLGTLLTVLGVIVLFLGKQGAVVNSNAFIGNLEVIIACLSWGIYTNYFKKYVKNIDLYTLTAGSFFYGAIFCALSCIGTVRLDMIHMTPNAWLAVLYVSTFASVVGFFAWNYGVKIVGASKSAPYINLLPVFTVVLGVLLLNEQLSGAILTGGLITILGAIIATFAITSSKESPASKQSCSQ